MDTVAHEDTEHYKESEDTAQHPSTVFKKTNVSIS